MLNEIISINQKKKTDSLQLKNNLSVVEKELAEPTFNLSKQFMSSLEQSKTLMNSSTHKGFSLTQMSRFHNNSTSVFLTQSDEQNPAVLTQTLDTLLESMKEVDSSIINEKSTQDIIHKKIIELKFSVVSFTMIDY